MNIIQFLEFQAISVAGGVIHKTIAMLHHVTTRVQHKDKYYWNLVYQQYQVIGI